MARYCCYCGTFFMTDGKKCESCGKAIVKQPVQVEGFSTDDDDEEEEEGKKSKLQNGEEEEEEDGIVFYRSGGLISPPAHQEMIYGFVERFRGEEVHTFHFYREADHAFIMAASMASTGEGPIYFHTRSDLNRLNCTMSQVPRRRGHRGFVGVLAPYSFLGMEFLISTVESTNTEQQVGSSSSSSSSRNSKYIPENNNNNNSSTPSRNRGKELALLCFDTNLIGQHPNTVVASVRINPASRSASTPLKPKVASRNKTRTAHDQSFFDRILGRTERSYRPLGQELEDDDEIATFETKKPEWSKDIGGWTLDFNGRVTISSKKNFILVPSAYDEILFGSDTIAVRFGKVSKHRFNLDYRFPFSPLTAFATAVSMFASKLVVAW